MLEIIRRVVEEMGLYLHESSRYNDSGYGRHPFFQVHVPDDMDGLDEEDMMPPTPKKGSPRLEIEFGQVGCKKHGVTWKFLGKITTEDDVRKVFQQFLELRESNQ